LLRQIVILGIDSDTRSERAADDHRPLDLVTRSGVEGDVGVPVLLQRGGESGGTLRLQLLQR